MVKNELKTQDSKITTPLGSKKTSTEFMVSPDIPSIASHMWAQGVQSSELDALFAEQERMFKA